MMRQLWPLTASTACKGHLQDSARSSGNNNDKVGAATLASYAVSQLLCASGTHGNQ